MADEADQAQQITDFDMEVALRRIKRPNGYGPPECDCGEPIPEPRRQHGFDTCIDCAIEMEKAERQGRM